MSFLVVLCEGYTEMDFVAQVLSEHLAKRGTACHPILLGNRCKHDVATAPGGVLKWGPVYRHINAALRRHSSETSYVTMMVDFYAFPHDFPDYRKLAAEPLAAKRVASFEHAIFEQMSRDKRFIPYIQLHEFEALIYSQLEQLRTEFADDHAALDGLNALIADVNGLTPEEIDQTKEGAPSKRLERFLPPYDKRTMGPRLIKQIGWKHLKDSCPHFGAWLTGLENL